MFPLETYKSITTPVMGHRSKDFVDLYNQCQPLLQKLFQTEDPVFLSTSSAWGVMEGSIRNLTQKKSPMLWVRSFFRQMGRCRKEMWERSGFSIC